MCCKIILERTADWLKYMSSTLDCSGYSRQYIRRKRKYGMLSVSQNWIIVEGNGLSQLCVEAKNSNTSEWINEVYSCVANFTSTLNYGTRELINDVI